MTEIHLRDVRRFWVANELLRHEKVAPVLDTVNKGGGVSAKSVWDYIVSFAFGRSWETFQAIQTLCNPDQKPNFWADGFILTRPLFETFVTLEWIAADTIPRAELFRDEYILKEAYLFEHLEEQQERVRPEKQQEIQRLKAEVLTRHNRGPGTLSLVPSMEQRVRDIAGPLEDIYPNLSWEYEVYYRDVSGFAHPSAWGTMSFIRSTATPLRAESTPEIGRKAVFCNGEWFLRVINRWNAVFQVCSREQISSWHAQWADTARGT